MGVGALPPTQETFGAQLPQVGAQGHPVSHFLPLPQEKLPPLALPMLPLAQQCQLVKVGRKV